MRPSTVLGAALSVALGGASWWSAAGVAATITLNGASQFAENHAITKTLRKFEELVVESYHGPEQLELVLHLDSELGLEKDYFADMSRGGLVDYAIVAPAHMPAVAAMARLMDMPMLFRDLDHWNKVLNGDALQPIADEIARSGVLVIGYAGGGTRNLIARRPVTGMAELAGLSIRVSGAPIQARLFEAIGAAPKVIAYSRTYRAMQTGTIDAAENEAASIGQLKLYEVGPHVALTRHAISVRPLCFSGETFAGLPADLQAAILEAGRAAAAYGREIEAGEDALELAQMEKDGLLTTHPFAERERLLDLAEPVKQAYAEELGALAVYRAIAAVR